MHCRLPDGRIYWSPTIKKEKTLRKEDRADGWGTIGPFKWTVFVVNTKQSLPSLSLHLCWTQLLIEQGPTHSPVSTIFSFLRSWTPRFFSMGTTNSLHWLSRRLSEKLKKFSAVPTFLIVPRVRPWFDLSMARALARDHLWSKLLYDAACLGGPFPASGAERSDVINGPLFIY